MTPPRKSSALPPAGINGASPKAISGRTSYLRVRLEFLPYPHLIPTLFNGCGFGPPPPFTAASAWARVGHPVSGLRCLTQRPFRGARALHARSHCGSAASRLNLARQRSSPDRSTKSTRSRPFGAPTVCGHRVSGSLSLPSRGPFHLSFTVLCSIGHWSVFSLAGWSPLLPTGFLVPHGTPGHASGRERLRLRGSHPLRQAFPGLSAAFLPAPAACPYPATHAWRFGLFPFRSPLLWESIFLSFPPAT